MKLLLSLLLCTSVLTAQKIDPSATHFGNDEKKQRVDLFDFSGEYLHLEKVNIDAKKKMRVEVLLDGSYPALKSLAYVGSFGTIDGTLTGTFPQIEKMDFICGSSSVNLNFEGKWEKDCVISVLNNYGDVVLTLPKNVALTVTTKTGPTCKVTPCSELKKKKNLNWMHKDFYNALGASFLSKKEVERDPALVHLHFNIEVKEGHITLK